MNYFRRSLIASIYLVFFLSFVLITLSRYNSGQLFYYDFGIFAHIIWQLSRFQIPYINHLVLGNVLFLGDHFNPSLIFIAPLFWVTSDVRILLIEQVFATVAAGFTVYLIAKKSNLPLYAALSLSVSYLLFAGVENPLVTDWHPEPTAAFVLLLGIYFFRSNSKRVLYIATFIIFLGFKESNALTLFFTLIWLFTIVKDRRKEIAIIALGSTIYFFLITRLVMPTIAHHAYLYSPSLPHSPVQLVQNFVSTAEKRKLIYDSLLSFGFLPLVSGMGIVMPMAEVGIRLVPNGTIFNNLTLGQHYNVLLGTLLTLAALQALVIIKKVVGDRQYILIFVSAWMVFSGAYAARKITGSPINVIINPEFYRTYNGDQELKELLTKVPHSGSIMSQNNLLAYLSNRTEPLYLLQPDYQRISPDTIALNFTPGANVNNYYGSSKEDAENIKRNLLQDSHYHQVQLKSKNTFLFIKNK